MESDNSDCRESLLSDTEPSACQSEPDQQVLEDVDARESSDRWYDLLADVDELAPFDSDPEIVKVSSQLATLLDTKYASELKGSSVHIRSDTFNDDFLKNEDEELSYPEKVVLKLDPPDSESDLSDGDSYRRSLRHREAKIIHGNAIRLKKLQRSEKDVPQLKAKRNLWPRRSYKAIDTRRNSGFCSVIRRVESINWNAKRQLSLLWGLDMPYSFTLKMYEITNGRYIDLSKESRHARSRKFCFTIQDYF
jgi:hypothetical protein